MVKITISCFLPPEEGIRHKEENIVANVEGKDLGNGTLYITESQLSWLGQHGHGFALLYPAISLHAISRDLNSFPDECLYLQVDGKMIDNEEEQQQNNSGSGEDDNEEDFEVSLAELRFIPANKEHLEAMFSAMSDCQALHPDEDDTDSEEEEEGEGFYFEGEGAEHMTEHGRATLQHLENIFQVGQGDVSNIIPLHANGSTAEGAVDDAMEMGQFDDAEMD